MLSEPRAGPIDLVSKTIRAGGGRVHVAVAKRPERICI